MNEAFRKLLIKQNSDNEESDDESTVDGQIQDDEEYVKGETNNIFDKLINYSHYQKSDDYRLKSNECSSIGANGVDVNELNGQINHERLESPTTIRSQVWNKLFNGVPNDESKIIPNNSASEANIQLTDRECENKTETKNGSNKSLLDKLLNYKTREESTDNQMPVERPESSATLANQSNGVTDTTPTVNVIDKLFKYYFKELADEPKHETNDLSNLEPKSGYFEYRDDTLDYYLILSVSQCLSSPDSKECTELRALFQMVCNRLKSEHNLKDINESECQMRFEKLFHQYLEVLKTSKNPFEARKSFKYLDLFNTIDFKMFLMLETDQTISELRKKIFTDKTGTEITTSNNTNDDNRSIDTCLSNHDNTRTITSTATQSKPNESQNSVEIGQDMADCFLSLTISHCLSVYYRQATEDSLSFWTFVSNIMSHEYNYKSMDAFGCRSRFTTLCQIYAKVLSSARTTKEAMGSLKCFRIFNTIDLKPLLTPNAYQFISQLRLKFWRVVNQFSVNNWSGQNSIDHHNNGNYTDHVLLCQKDFESSIDSLNKSIESNNIQQFIESNENILDHYLCVCIGQCLASNYKQAIQDTAQFWATVSNKMTDEFSVIHKYGLKGIDALRCRHRFEELLNRYVQILTTSRTMIEARDQFYCFAIIHKMNLKPLLTPELFKQLCEIKLKFLISVYD